jgi:mannosyltransferase
VSAGQVTTTPKVTAFDARRRGARGQRVWPPVEVFVVAGLTMFVVVAAGWNLGRASLSGDEAATWAISGHGLGDVVHVLRGSGGDRAAGLYYVAIYAWARIFGTGVVALRSLSVVAAGIAIAPFHAIVRRLGRPTAFAADTLLATSPFFLAHAREARAYSMALTLVVLASWAFLRAVERDRRRDWIVYVTVAVLALYTQWFAALVLLAQFSSRLAVDRRARWSRRATISGGCLAVGAVPIVVLVLSGDTGGVGWIAPLSGAQIRAVLATFAGSSSWLAQAAVLAVVAVGLAAAVRVIRRERSTARGSTAALALAWLVLPFAAVVAVSAVKPLLVSRYLIVALPGFAVLLGLGLTRVSRGRVMLVAIGVAALIALGSSAYDQVWAARHADEDWRGIVETVDRHAGANDGIIVFPGTAAYGFGYYARGAPSLARRSGPTWPTTSWNTPFGKDAASAPAALSAVAALRGRVVWLVVRQPGGPTVRASVSDPKALNALRGALSRRFPYRRPVRPFVGHTVSLVRYSMTPDR